MLHFSQPKPAPYGALRHWKPAFAGFFALLFLTLSSVTANASHFRGGTLTWQQAGGNSITYTLNTSWRRGYPWPANPVVNQVIQPGTFYFGDGTTANIMAVVNSVDAAADVISTTWTVTKTYATPGNYVANAFISSARLSSLFGGNADAPYNLQATVNVGSTNNSPVSSVPPIITLPINATTSFTIPGSDPDGDNITFRISLPALPVSITDQTRESGLNVPLPPGFSLAPNGTATMNTTGLSIGATYAVQVMMEDRVPVTNQIKSKSPVDFLIRMVAPSAPPVFVAPTPLPPNNVFNVLPGNPVSFTIAATDPDVNQFVTLKPVPVPLGSTMTPPLPESGPVNGTASSTFNWTPTNAQVGTYVITFVAADDVNVQTLTSVTINVLCTLDGTTSVTDNLCNGDNAGAVDLTVTNFSTQANLQYSWTGPNSFSANTEDISGLAGGSYTVTIFDNGTGCSTTETVTVGEPSAVGASITSNTPVTCPGGNDGSLTVSASGGTPGYTYSWSSGGTADTENGLAVGSYTVTVTDANGCTATASDDIIQVDNELPTITAPADVTVNTDPGQCSATNPNIGTPQASDNCAYSVNNPGNATFPLGSTTVTWVVTDGSGNMATATQVVTVVDDEDPVVAAPANVTDCDNGTNTHTLTATASDNCIGTTLSWVATDASNNSIGSGSGGTASANFPVGVNTVTWTAMDGSGNTATGSSTVTINALPGVSIASVNTFCGQNTIYIGYGPSSITLVASAGGGTAPYTYSWNGGPFNPSPSLTVSPTSTTTYTVTVMDANGCMGTASVEVKVLDVRCGNNNNKVQICHNGNALCVAAASVPSHLAHGDCLGDCTSAFARSVASKIDLEAGNMVIFPNPAQDKINVTLKDNGETYTSWQITDVSGRVVLSAKLNAATHADLLNIDVSSLAPGLYVIRAGSSAAKFTVE